MNLYVLIHIGAKPSDTALLLAESEADAREIARVFISPEFAVQARSFTVPLDEAGLVFVGTK